MLVKLDVFHWFMRWDDILLNKSSKEASFFRHLMRRAIFVVEDAEHARVRYLKPGITPKEIHKYTKATIPPAEILTKRLQCTLNHIFMRDYETDTQNTTDSEEQPQRKRYLKHFDTYVKKGPRRVRIRQLINNQVEHVEKGCLSDPPSDIVKIHRINPRTKEVRSARGTGGCENDHRWLNDLLDAPSVGVARAERVIDDFYEMSNDRKLVN